jgi:thiamine pyrophosphate-dependent acetolactate synthase large subunit-like protein
MSTRESTINLILDIIPKDSLVVACNGKIGRELWELRTERGESPDDFIMLGSMGCALGIALGVAMNTPKQVYCLIGDGNFLMKMGTLATLKKLNPKNLHVYILNNGAHDSTGGQETSFDAIKRFLPYNINFRVIDVEKGAREDLGRPTVTAPEITKNFMRKVQAKPVKTLTT